MLALVATSAVTLGVAALTLLPPLERRLRKEEVESLLSTAVAFRPVLQDVEAAPAREPSTAALTGPARSLERRTGARVVIFDDRLTPVVDTLPPRSPGRPVPPDQLLDRFPEARVALSSRRPVGRPRGGSPGEAEVAVPLHVHRRRYVVALHKRLGDVTVAVGVVKRAFASAAAAGLGVALLLGLGLATTLLRRLRRLRDSAIQVGERGLDVTVPEDRRRDEVGDLSRALGSMQTQLRQQEDARRQFVATASHELRTPLASLHGVLELLEDDLGAEPVDIGDARLQVERARTQTRRLVALAADLLDLSRLDADIELRQEPVELTELCRAAASEFDVRLQERDLALEMATPDTPVWAIADPGGVARIVRILIDNALRFTPPAAPVRVSLATHEGSAQIAVSDRGPGVRDEERELFFERFRRGSTPGDAAGFGLGLAIGRELAERMSGRLDVGSGNGGARFTLALPASDVPE
ncbi:MAG: HAMP domain-containing histidine kinase [Actinomycetota bacterium]|nr:HAMP domain-containing histidine kinase [Actinomycetota bacterium]